MAANNGFIDSKPAETIVTNNYINADTSRPCIIQSPNDRDYFIEWY